MAITVPLSALLPWTLLDKTLPASDPAQYLETSYKIYDLWNKQGFRSALPAFYFLRGWKPTLYLVFGALSLKLTSGDVLWAIRLCNIGFYVLFLTYLFLGFELFLSASASALATILLGLLPWCTFSAHYYGLEIPVLATIVAALYWLFRAWDLSSARNARWFGFFLGMGLCFRPPDVLLFFFLPILFWAARNIWNKRLKRVDLVTWSIAALPFVFLFFRHEPGELLSHLALSVIPALCLFAARKRLGLNSNFGQAFLVAYLLMTLWYAPFLDQLYKWIYEAGFSPAAQLAHTEFAGFELVGRFLYWLCGIPMLVLAAAAILGYTRDRRTALLMILATASVSLVAASFSHDVVIRNHYGSAILLHAGALVFALSAKTRFRGVLSGIVACLAASLWIWNLGSVFAPESTPRLLPDDPTKEYFYPFSPQERDPSAFTLDVLARNLPQRPLNIVIFPLFPPELMGYLQVPEYLSIAAQQRGLSWQFTMSPAADPSTDLVLFAVDRASEARFAPMVLDKLPDWSVSEEFAWPAERRDIDVVVKVLKRK